MTEYEISQIKEYLKKEFWGYEVLYYPDHKDYVVERKTKKIVPFLFFFHKTIWKSHPETILKKEDMVWERLDAIWSLPFSKYERKESYYLCINHDLRLILFR